MCRRISRGRSVVEQKLGKHSEVLRVQSHLTHKNAKSLNTIERWPHGRQTRLESIRNSDLWLFEHRQSILHSRALLFGLFGGATASTCAGARLFVASTRLGHQSLADRLNDAHLLLRDKPIEHVELREPVELQGSAVVLGFELREHALQRLPPVQDLASIFTCIVGNLIFNIEVEPCFDAPME